MSVCVRTRVHTFLTPFEGGGKRVAFWRRVLPLALWRRNLLLLLLPCEVWYSRLADFWPDYPTSPRKCWDYRCCHHSFLDFFFLNVGFWDWTCIASAFMHWDISRPYWAVFEEENGLFSSLESAHSVPIEPLSQSRSLWAICFLVSPWLNSSNLKG